MNATHVSLLLELHVRDLCKPLFIPAFRCCCQDYLPTGSKRFQSTMITIRNHFFLGSTILNLSSSPIANYKTYENPILLIWHHNPLSTKLFVTLLRFLLLLGSHEITPQSANSPDLSMLPDVLTHIFVKMSEVQWARRKNDQYELHVRVSGSGYKNTPAVLSSLM